MTENNNEQLDTQITDIKDKFDSYCSITSTSHTVEEILMAYHYWEKYDASHRYYKKGFSVDYKKGFGRCVYASKLYEINGEYYVASYEILPPTLLQVLSKFCQCDRCTAPIYSVYYLITPPSCLKNNNAPPNQQLINKTKRYFMNCGFILPSVPL